MPVRANKSLGANESSKFARTELLITYGSRSAIHLRGLACTSRFVQIICTRKSTLTCQRNRSPKQSRHTSWSFFEANRNKVSCRHRCARTTLISNIVLARHSPSCGIKVPERGGHKRFAASRGCLPGKKKASCGGNESN